MAGLARLDFLLRERNALNSNTASARESLAAASAAVELAEAEVIRCARLSLHWFYENQEELEKLAATFVK